MAENTEFSISNRTISGDITPTNRSNVTQKTAKEFIESVDKILGFPGVQAVRWRQYTPYFNDGDPCEFTVSDLSVKVEGMGEEDGGDYDDGFYDRWSLKYDGEEGILDVPDGLIETIKEAWTPASFEQVALANFGDHAIVTATTEGFSVEFYNHD